MDRYEKKKVVYTAQSKHLFYAKMLICKFVLEKDYIPLNPFNNWAYFLDDMVDRNIVARANNNLIMISDELWQFGPIADGCLEEIRFAVKQNKNIRFFSAGKKSSDIKELNIDELVFEEEVLLTENKEKLLEEIKKYYGERML